MTKIAPIIMIILVCNRSVKSVLVFNCCKEGKVMFYLNAKVNRSKYLHKCF